ncbi:hypothetical protein F2P79_025646 [Pimephales promelas]|nr:hypothetical protein F2P79_025646 [Pimephales promelas]
MPQSPCLNRPQPAKEPLPQTTAWLQKGCNKANQKGPKIHSGPCIYPRHADKTFTCKLSNQHDCMKQILLDMDYVQSRESDQGLSPPWTSSKTDLKLHRLRQAYFEKQTIRARALKHFWKPAGDPEWTASTKRLKPNQPERYPLNTPLVSTSLEHTSDNNSAATSQTAEILKGAESVSARDITRRQVRHPMSQRKTQARHPETLLVSIRPQSSRSASQSDNTKQPPQLTAAQPEHDSPVSHTRPVLTAHRSQHQPRCLNFWEP